MLYLDDWMVRDSVICLIDFDIPWLIILTDYDWLSWVIIDWLLIDYWLIIDWLWLIMSDYEWLWMIMSDYDWLYDWLMNDYDWFWPTLNPNP